MRLRLRLRLRVYPRWREVRVRTGGNEGQWRGGEGWRGVSRRLFAYRLHDDLLARPQDEVLLQRTPLREAVEEPEHVGE